MVLQKRATLGFVKGRIDFVKHTNWTWVRTEDGHNQSDGRHGFRRRKVEKAHEAAFREGGSDFNPGFQEIDLSRFRRYQFKLRGTAAKELPEHAVLASKVVPDPFERIAKHGSAFGIKLFDQFGKTNNGGFKVGDLLDQFLVVFIQFLFFLNGIQIDVSQRSDFFADGGEPFFTARSI